MDAKTLAGGVALTLGVLLAGCDGTAALPDAGASSSPAPTIAPAGPAPGVAIPAPTRASTMTAGPPAVPQAGPQTVPQTTVHVTPSAVPTPNTGAEHEAAPVRLSPGEQASFAGWTVTFIEVTADSRCPVDVVCVWAGEIVIALAVRDPSGLTSRSEVRFQGEPVSVVLQDGLIVSVEGVTPAPRSTSVIAAGDYVVSGWFLASH